LCTIGRICNRTRAALLWQHNANPSYKLASTPRYDDIVRTAGWAGSARAAGRRPAGDGGGAPKTARRIREAGAPARRRPAADGSVLNITAAVWTAGFHWWRSGKKKRTQNVSEYMLVGPTRCMPGCYILSFFRDVVHCGGYIPPSLVRRLAVVTFFLILNICMTTNS